MNAPKPRSRVHLFVENGGQYRPFDDWISWAEDQIVRQSAEIEELKLRSAQATAELAVARSEFQEAQAFAQRLTSHDELDQRMNELDGRLNKVLALVNDNLGGGQSEQDILHHTHASEYVSLVEQRVLSLMLDVFRDSLATPQDKAKFVASACAALFGSREVREEDLISSMGPGLPAPAIERAREICAQVRALRTKIDDGRPQSWRFECTQGIGIDPDWQEPWAGSVADGVVDFVVAPAYVVDSDTLLAKQWVFTVPRADGSTKSGGSAAARQEHQPAENPTHEQLEKTDQHEPRA
jgi:hypothetical protein